MFWNFLEQNFLGIFWPIFPKKNRRRIEKTILISPEPRLKSYVCFSDIQHDLNTGKVTTLGLVQYYLSNIERNSFLGAFLEVYREESLEAARLVDLKIQNGTAGKLAGMVLGIKDVFCYKDHPVTVGSSILTGFKSLFTATAIQRLLDEDAIIIGRQNCDEFAMGSSNENSSFGSVRNAADPSKVPGGSSGGSNKVGV